MNPEYQNNPAPAMPSMHDDVLRQMFAQFLEQQNNSRFMAASKSDKAPDPEIFTAEGSSIDVIHEKLETFAIQLELKMTLNMDRMPTPDTRVAHTFSRTSGTAQGYIAPNITAK
ncbi:MAG: hypothetical protein M1823_007232, partial [Watsoniomyces obsoletus]